MRAAKVFRNGRSQAVRLPINTLAAQAVTNDLIMVTNNTAEFERVDGLTLQNWT